jgi:hypothetical protein
MFLESRDFVEHELLSSGKKVVEAEMKAVVAVGLVSEWAIGEVSVVAVFADDVSAVVVECDGEVEDVIGVVGDDVGFGSEVDGCCVEIVEGVAVGVDGSFNEVYHDGPVS